MSGSVVKRFSTGVVNATIFSNTSSEGQEYKTVSFTRRYADKKGTWKSTNTLRVMDLPKAACVLKKAFEYLAVE